MGYFGKTYEYMVGRIVDSDLQLVSFQYGWAERRIYINIHMVKLKDNIKDISSLKNLEGRCDVLPYWHSIPVRDIISYMRRVLPRPLFYLFLVFYFLTIPIWVIYWMIRGRNFYLYPALTEWGTKRNIEALRKRVSENLNRIDAQFKEWEKEYEPTPSDESGIPIISNRAFLINKETDE